MKFKIILIVISVILLGGNVFFSYEWHKSHKTKKEYFSLIEKQSATIDSLVNHPAKSVRMEVKMDLTDKSKFEINGKNNSGTINVPNERKYILEIEYDSIITSVVK